MVGQDTNNYEWRGQDTTKYAKKVARVGPGDHKICNESCAGVARTSPTMSGVAGTSRNMKRKLPVRPGNHKICKESCGGRGEDTTKYARKVARAWLGHHKT